MMKGIPLPILALMIALACARADTIVQWNFNSVPPDADTSTGKTFPAIGNGAASSLNGISAATFSTGSTNDPASQTDDSGWVTSHYPSQGVSNKTAGVQFSTSTLGYSNIVIRWDLRVTGTASKYYRLQYSTDGSTFANYPTANAAQLAAPTASYYEAQTNSFAAITAVNNRATFAFRIVSEFVSTATMSGADEYFTVGASDYGPNTGTARFDFVTVSGDPIPGANTAPTISALGSQTLHVGQATGPLAFTLHDAEDSAANLTLNKTSSDLVAVPLGNITFSGSGSNRSVNVTAGSQPGTSTIAIWVIDTGGRSNQSTFLVTVLPANTPPVISSISTTNTLAGLSTAPIPFTIGDGETAAASLIVSGSSSNTSLVPNPNLVFGGSGSNRTVSVTPAPGQTGVAPLAITVSDGTNTASSVFTLMVTPSSGILFYDPFNYPNGSLLTNSGYLWDSRSGVFGQCQVTNGRLQVIGTQGEDVAAPLVGAPYNKNNNTVLYAAFKVTFLTLPKTTPDYFAHFTSGSSTFRGRIYAGIPANAPSGSFRLYVSNGSAPNPTAANDLNTNIAYTLVTRYDIDTAATTLWVNPASENAPGVTATDAQSAASISSFGFRQDAGLGATIQVDDFKAGLSFAAVTGTATSPAPIPLVFQRSGNNLILNWSDPTFTLQSAPLAPGPYTTIPTAASPYTNPLSGPPKFFRLKSN